MKIETFKISVACKDDVRREDLAESIQGFLNRNMIDTDDAYGAEVDGFTESKAPAAKPAEPPKKRRGRRSKAELLAETGKGGGLKVERRGNIPAGANAPSNA